MNAIARSVTPRPDGLKEHLDALTLRFGKSFRDRDPVQFPHRYAAAADREVAALLSALLAFGKVEVVLRNLEDLFERLGPRPATTLGGLTPRTAAAAGARVPPPLDRRRRARGPLPRGRPPARAGRQSRVRRSPRATTRRTRRSSPGSRRSQPRRAPRDRTPSRPRDEVPVPVARARRRLQAASTSSCAGSSGPPTESTSASGRRSIAVAAPRSRSTPTSRSTRACSGCRGGAQADWRMVEEVTAALRAIDPADPVRYDFALCHLGIHGDCKKRRDPVICPRCPIDALCRLPARRSVPMTTLGSRGRSRPRSRPASRCRGEDLGGLDFNGASLRGADLRGCRLDGARFIRCRPDGRRARRRERRGRVVRARRAAAGEPARREGRVRATSRTASSSARGSTTSCFPARTSAARRWTARCCASPRSSGAEFGNGGPVRRRPDRHERRARRASATRSSRARG